jgi:hypothetical protein
MARPERAPRRSLSGERIWLRPEGADAGTAAIVRREDGETIGELTYRLTDGWLVVEAITLPPGERGRGYDSEAVRLLEEEAARRGARRSVMSVAKEDGLALYFALRLGYRPAVAGELWHWGTGGDIIAMVRTPGGRD